MDWMLILDLIGQAGMSAAPVIATIIMTLAGVVFYQLTGLLPGFVRAYVEKVYRDKEALFRDAITKALINGITAAVARGKRGRDALTEAIDHAVKTNPEGVAHFQQTSNMDRQTLLTMAERAAVDLGLKLDADQVSVSVEAPH